MDLKFTFGASNASSHDHHDDHDDDHDHSHTPPFVASNASVLELRVTRENDEIICNALSGDGVSYAKTSRTLSGEDQPALATAIRSTLARCGAELVEPLIESVTAIVLSLGGEEAGAIAALGLSPRQPDEHGQVAEVDDALQARTGITSGTPILAA